MTEVHIVGLDLAKRVFQAHGAALDGTVVFRKKLSRNQVLTFLSAQRRCIVAMEACASAHHWGREIGALGHEVRLIAPAYVKPFVKRQKNDMADAEAISEAASRANMRFVPVKSAEKQASAVAFKTRDFLVRQRSQSINALRGHVGEFGFIAPQGVAHAGKLAAWIRSPDCDLPEAARAMCLILVEMVDRLSEQISHLNVEIASRARRDETSRRLMTITRSALVLSDEVKLIDTMNKRNCPRSMERALRWLWSDHRDSR